MGEKRTGEGAPSPWWRRDRLSTTHEINPSTYSPVSGGRDVCGPAASKEGNARRISEILLKREEEVRESSNA